MCSGQFEGRTLRNLNAISEDEEDCTGDGILTMQCSDGDDATTQVYQWQESEDSVSTNRDSGDHDAHVEKSYSYATDWVDHHIDSSNFANTLGEGMRNQILSAVQQL